MTRIDELRQRIAVLEDPKKIWKPVGMGDIMRLGEETNYGEKHVYAEDQITDEANALLRNKIPESKVVRDKPEYTTGFKKKQKGYQNVLTKSNAEKWAKQKQRIARIYEP
jgi:hypothetical protein